MLDYRFLQHTYKLNVFLILYRFVNKPFFPELSVFFELRRFNLVSSTFISNDSILQWLIRCKLL